ncbi:MAG: hypothetical protein NPIRA04_23780 [Nitrospirales bacterium]|nr:MAG: hypothetical protein NPIRA04_23780 [Nitrospirales bacterium]
MAPAVTIRQKLYGSCFLYDRGWVMAVSNNFRMFEVNNCAGFVDMPRLEFIWIRYNA